MVELFTALGLKGAMDADQFESITHGIFDGPTLPEEAYIREGSCELHLERRRNMGPFSLVLRLPNLSQNPIDSLLPMVRERDARRMAHVSLTEPRPGSFLIRAFDTKTGEQIDFIPTAIVPIFRQNPDPIKEPAVLDGFYSCYGLSAEGSVILGNETNTIAETQEWQKTTNNDEKDSIIKKRLRNEDALSVVDAYFVQEEEPATYQFMGVIGYVDRLLNPATSEWVYRLFIRINQEGYGVYIHPEMLMGEPKVGRRFKGKVTFFGMMNPKDLNRDRDNGFY